MKTAKEIENLFLIEILPIEEHIPVEDNCIDSGDPKFDRKVERGIRKKLNAGNIWAWCTVEVRVSVPGMDVSGSAYLGCCSYKNEKDFRKSGYLDQMITEAFSELCLDEIKESIPKHIKALDAEFIVKACNAYYPLKNALEELIRAIEEEIDETMTNMGSVPELVKKAKRLIKE